MWPPKSEKLGKTKAKADKEKGAMEKHFNITTSENAKKLKKSHATLKMATA